MPRPSITPEPLPAAAAPPTTQPTASPPPAPAAAPAQPAAGIPPSASTGSLRSKGTATNEKWAQYASADAGVARPRRVRRSVSVGETLHAAVRSTSRLRLALAALLAVLLAGRWDAAALASGGGCAPAPSLLRQPAAEAPPAAGAAVGPSGLQAGWHGAVQQLRRAAAAAFPSLLCQLEGLATPPPPPPSGLAATLAGKAKGQLAALAATRAGQKASAALHAMQRQLAAAAASPAGQHAGAALRAVRVQLAAAAASPAGQQAAAGVAAARQLLTGARSAAARQLAAARASAAGQRAEAALSTLSHAAAAAPQRLRGLAAAAAATPAGQRALRLADGLPPLACVLLLDCSLIGAAAAAMAAAPSLVHSTVRCGVRQGAPRVWCVAASSWCAAAFCLLWAGRQAGWLAGRPAGRQALVPCEPHREGKRQPVVTVSLSPPFPSSFPCVVQLELDTQAPGVLQRVVALLPGLAPRLSLLLALPRLLTSLLDDAAAFLVALVGYHLLPVLLGGSLG